MTGQLFIATLFLRPPGGGKGPGARGGKVRTSSGGRKRSSSSFQQKAQANAARVAAAREFNRRGATPEGRAQFARDSAIGNWARANSRRVSLAESDRAVKAGTVPSSIKKGARRPASLSKSRKK